MSAQLIQLGFIFSSYPIFSCFSVLARFIRSLCVALLIHIIHGHRVCLSAGGELFLLLWVLGALDVSGA